MKRRHFLSLISTAAVGGSVAVGTGAFSNVQAQRDLSVNVAGDANAYLRIAPSDGPNGKYATGADDGALALDFTGSNENVPGSGINRDAVTYFDEVFVVQNQGTQRVTLTVSPISFVELEPGVILVFLIVPLDSPVFRDDSLDLPLSEDDPEADGTVPTWGLTKTPLDVGDSARFSVLAASCEISDGVEIGFSDQIEITAEAPQDD